MKMSAINSATGESVRLYPGHKAFDYFERLSDNEKSKFESVADWWLSLGKAGRRKLTNDYLKSCWTDDKRKSMSSKKTGHSNWIKSATPDEVNAYKKKMSDMWTSEMREERSKAVSNMWAEMPDDKKEAHARRVKAYYTNEVREVCRKRGLSYESTLTDEQKKARSKKFRDWMTLERRLALREASKKSYDLKTDSEKIMHRLNCKRAVAGGVSVGERELLEFVRSCVDAEVIGSCNDVIPGKELDIYIPSKHLAIEYNGVWWHCDRVMDKYDNYQKYVLCQRNGIRLIQIWECDWVTKRVQVEALLRSVLGVSRRIYARDCSIGFVSAFEKDTFLDVHHMQGADKSSLAVGLKFGEELVAVMTFRRSRNNKDFELSRYCGEVVGGFSRLLKYSIPMLKEIGISELISYSDNMLFSGDTYKLNGWELVSELSPDYRIFYKGRIYHKSTWRKEFIKQRFPEFKDSNLTEWQMEDTVKALRIWDCGKKKWKINF